jgi:hypothetical protein
LGQLGLKTGQKLQTIKKIQNPKTWCACPMMMMMMSFLLHDELTTPTWVKNTTLLPWKLLHTLYIYIYIC